MFEFIISSFVTLLFYGLVPGYFNCPTPSPGLWRTSKNSGVGYSKNLGKNLG
jgi:hypothetical protein